jgi:hypothetical protein
MTVQSNYTKAGPFLPEGQRVFPFRFRVLAPEQVRVYLGASALEPMQGYSVSLSDNGGEVVFDTPPAEVVTMLRDMDFGQSVDLQNNTAFLAEVLEEALDKLTMMCQQLKLDAERSVKIPVDSEADSEDYYRLLLGASEDAAYVRDVKQEIESYFNGELKELTVNLIGEAAAAAEYVAGEVTHDK